MIKNLKEFMFGMKYRKEIEGLRAFAVISVILFHTGMKIARGGFIGVDIFFVISGYLITYNIISNLNQNKFSFMEFAEKRMRRLLPLLLFVLTISIPFSWILLPPPELVNYSKSLVTTALFTSNFFFWKTGDYFQTSSELKPLLHTWSLAIEGQFYLLYPIFLVFIWKCCKKLICPFLLLTSFLGLMLSQWIVTEKPDAAFYLLPTRGWEMLVGGIAAFFITKSEPIQFNKTTREIGGWLGLACLFFSVFQFDSSIPLPSIYTLIPTLGTLLILIFANQQTSIGKFISQKLFVGIGLISYSAYLWHQPIFAYARYSQSNIGLTLWLIIIFFVFAISILTWRFIEIPFRDESKFPKKFIYLLFIFGTFFFVLTGTMLSKIDFEREDTLAKELSQNTAIFASNINERIFQKARIKYEKGNPIIVAIGSSRIKQLNTNIAGNTFINLSVSGASIEDLVAIWWMSSRKFQPSVIYLGIDPWIFNINSGQMAWRTLSAEYAQGMKQLGLEKQVEIPPAKSTSYLNKLAVSFYDFSNLSQISAIDDAPSIADKVRRDGSRVYNLSIVNKSPSEVERRVKEYFNYSMYDYSFSNTVQPVLKALIQHIQTENRKIVLVMSPYHPILYESMTSNNQILFDIEQVVRDIAKSQNVLVIGSYNPLTIGCNREDFYDGMHPKESCIKKFFALSSR